MAEPQRQYKYSVDEFIKYLREKDPEFSKGGRYQKAPDHIIYHLGAEKYSQSRADIEPWSTPEGIEKLREEADENINPGWWNSIKHSPVGVGGIPIVGSILDKVSGGILGPVDAESYDWQKAALQGALTGVSELAMGGKLPFELKEYDLNPLEEIAAAVYGLTFPLDAITMFGGGGIAGAGLKVAAKKVIPKEIMKKKMFSNLAKEGVKNKAERMAIKYGLDKSVVGSTVERMAGSAGQFMLYEGAKGGASAKANGEDWKQGVWEGVQHGAIVGGALGFGGGVLEHMNKNLLFARASKKGNFKPYGLTRRSAGMKETLKSMTKSNPYSKWTNKQLDNALRWTGKYAQYGTEVGTFTGVGQVQRWKDGEEFTWSRLARDLFVNAGFIGTLKAGNKGMQKLAENTEMLSTLYENKLKVALKKAEEKDSFDKVKEDINSQKETGNNKLNKKLTEQEIIVENQNSHKKEIEILKSKVQDYGNLKTRFQEIQKFMKSLIEIEDPADAIKLLEKQKNIVNDIQLALLESQGTIKDQKLLGIESKKIDAHIKEAIKIEESINKQLLKKKEILKTDTKTAQEDFSASIAQLKQQGLTKIHSLNKAGKLVSKDIDKATFEKDAGTIKRAMELAEEAAARKSTDIAKDILEGLEGKKPEVKFGEEHGTTDADYKKMQLEGPEGRENIFTDYRTKENFADIIRAFKGITKTVKKKILQGVKEFYPEAPQTAKRRDLNNLLEYAAWLKKNNIEFGKNTKADFIRYLETTGKWDKRAIVANSLAKFFGTRKEGSPLEINAGQGYAGKYMKKLHNVLGVKHPEVKEGKATRITYKDRQKMKTSVNKTFGKKKEIDISEIGEGKGSIVKNVIDSILGVFYNTAKRSGEVLRLRAEDINVKDGTVRFFITKRKSQETFKDAQGKEMKDSDGRLITGEYVTYDLKQTNPNLWTNLLKSLKGKKGKDYIFTLKGSDKPLTGAQVNKILDTVLKKAGVKPISIRGGEKFTTHHHRHSMLADAMAMKTKGWGDYFDLVKDVYFTHQAKGDATKHYKGKYSTEQIKEFHRLRKKLKEGDVTDADVEAARKALETAEKELGIDPETIKDTEPITKKKKKPTVTLPHEPPKEKRQRKALEDITEAKKIHDDAVKNKEIPKGSTVKEQKQAAKDKFFVIGALEDIARGESHLIPKALESIKRFKGTHKTALKNKEGSVAHHKKWIKKYENMEKTLKEAETEVDFFKDYGYKSHRTMTKHAFGAAREAGRYNKQSKDIKDLFPKTKKTKISQLTPGELKTYIDSMTKLVGKGTKSKFPAKQKEAERIAEDYNISYDSIVNILKSMGVKDGKFENVDNINVLKRFISIIEQNYTKNKPMTTATSLVAGASTAKGLGNLTIGKQAWYPLVELLYRYGGDNGKLLADKFLDFDVANIRYRRHAKGTMEKVKTALKQAGFKGKEGYMFQFIDPELRKQWKKDITDREAEFIKLLVSKTKNPINQVAGQIRKMYNQYWSELIAVAQSVVPKSKQHLVVEYFNQQKLENYFTRRVNRDVLTALANTKGVFYKELLNKNIKLAAQALKRKDFKTDKAFEKAKNDYLNYLKGKKKLYPYNEAKINKIKEDIQNFFFKPQTRVNLGFDKSRTFTLPRKSKIENEKGKEIEVDSYVESLDATVGYYGVGMSKFLSTLKYFPEFTDIGKKFGGAGFKRNIFEMLSAERPNKGLNERWAMYMRAAISEHLGIDSDYRTSINSKYSRKLGEFSTLSAAMGLSSPTSGLKNLAIGIPRSIGHFGFINTTLAIVRMGTKHEDLMKRDLDWVREYGSKQLLLEAQKLPFGLENVVTMERLFNFNQMTRTEGWNRIVSSYAGNMTFETMLSAYHGEASKGFLNSISAGRRPIGGKKEILRAFRDVWQLSKAEIDFLKNTKFEDMRSPKNLEMMDWITTKVQHYSHVSTQGSTSSALLPRWMSNEWTRPLTLFQRMAWSTTTDIHRNYIRPLQHGNVAPLMRAAVGHTLSGAALYEVYKFLFDYEVPQQFNENEMQRWLPYLWKSEFFGLFGEAVNPHTSGIYDPKKGALSLLNVFGGDAVVAKSMLEPVIVRNARILGENVPLLLYSIFQAEYTPKFWHQSMRDVVSNSFVLGGQVLRFTDNYQSTQYVTHKKIKAVARDFMKQKGWSYPTNVMEHVRSPYYRDLKKSFWYGNKDEWSRTYWNAYNFLVTELQKDYRTPAGADKEARKLIKQSLSYMSPIKFSVDIDGRTVSKRTLFLNHLKANDKKKYDEAIALEKEYHFRYRKLMAEVKKYKNRQKYSVLPVSKIDSRYTSKLFGRY